MNNTVSFCSGLSRIKTNTVIYREILENRKDHPLFLEIDEDNVVAKKWYYINKEGVIFGPLNSIEMNKLFELKVLLPRTEIKQKSDDKYICLTQYVRRYYKKCLEKKHDLLEDKSKISKKLAKFRKGKLAYRKTGFLEKYEFNSRKERVNSQAVRPNFVCINDLLIVD